MIRLSLKFNASAFQSVVQKTAQTTIRSFLSKVAEKMRFLMRLPKSGRTYRSHQASAPGEAPGIVSGSLLRSIGEPTISGLRGQLRVTAAHAAYLERGTTHIKARPFAGPAVEGVLAEINRGGTFRRL